LMLKEMIEKDQRGEEFNREVDYTYLSTILIPRHDVNTVTTMLV